MGYYDVIQRISHKGKKKWFWYRKKNGRFNTTREAQREASRLNREAKGKT